MKLRMESSLTLLKNMTNDESFMYIYYVIIWTCICYFVEYIILLTLLPLISTMQFIEYFVSKSAFTIWQLYNRTISLDNWTVMWLYYYIKYGFCKIIIQYIYNVLWKMSCFACKKFFNSFWFLKIVISCPMMIKVCSCMCF